LDVITQRVLAQVIFVIHLVVPVIPVGVWLVAVGVVLDALLARVETAVTLLQLGKATAQSPDLV